MSGPIEREAVTSAEDVVVGDPPTGRRVSRVLVTNDDGVDAPGIACLAQAVADVGLTPVVVAPDGNSSGAGTGIGLPDIGAGLPLRPATALPGAHAIAGPPGLAVLTSALGAFGPAHDLVVSGVNAGSNTGHSVIHSGTVGAALTAQTFGCSGLAVSLAPGADGWRWDTAGVVARLMVAWLVEQASTGLVLNVNVPALPLEAIRGISWATLAPFGHIRVASVNEAGDAVEFGVHGEGDDGGAPGSDHALLQEGHVTVTALTGVREELLGGGRRPPALPRIG